VSGCTKYDDSALWDEVNSQAARIAALEAWQATVNSNITALQGLVNALQNNRYVTDVTTFTDPAPGGYTITFSSGTPITIRNGANGEKGDKGDTGAAGSTPQIGVAKDTDNIYYWTLNGSWLEDGEGNKIRVTGEKGDKGEDGKDGEDGEDGADGITPQLRINATTNYWEICTNGTCTEEEDWTSTYVKATGDPGAAGAQGPQGDAIFAANGVDNANADYVVFTLAGGETTIQVPKYRPLGIAFTQPTPFTNGESRGISFTVAGNVQSITAVDVPRGWTVTPDLTNKKITVTAPAAGGSYYTAAGTVTLLVSDNAERTVTAPLALECPAYVPPAELGISFTQPTAFLLGETKTVGFTTTGNAATVKVVDIPAGGWTVAVAKSGSAGTFTITASATGATGEALVLVSDDAGNVKMRTLGLVIFRAASTQTWTFGSQTWSDAIRIPDCNKNDFTDSSTEPQCRSYTSGTNTWYYYNWPYVNENAAALCPSPWRVPSQSDFNTLVSNTDYTALVSEWGYGGQTNMVNTAMDAYYWSSTQRTTDTAYRLFYLSGYLTVANSNKYYGFQVRCVK
jgi:hypothetical protein